MRVLTRQEKIEKKIYDAEGGEYVSFYHSFIDYPQRIRYIREVYNFKKNENGEVISELIPDKRVEMGALVLTGIQENYFTDETGKIISSNPENENYRADWKDLLINAAPELLGDFAIQVFESGPNTAAKKEYEKIEVKEIKNADGSKDNKEKSESESFLTNSAALLTHARPSEESNALKSKAE